LNQKRHYAIGDFLKHSLQEIINLELARRSVTQETLERYRESALMHRATLQLNNSLVLEEVTNNLIIECQNASVKVEMGIIFGFDSDLSEYNILNSFGHIKDSDFKKVVNSTLFIEIAQKQQGEIINDLSENKKWNNEVPEIKSILFIPLKSSGKFSGMMVLASSKSSNKFRSDDLQKINTISSIASTAMANANYFEEINKMLNSMMHALATAIDSRDPCTSGHSQRVAKYSMTFAQYLTDDNKLCPEISFSEDELEEIYNSAMLHYW